MTGTLIAHTSPVEHAVLVAAGVVALAVYARRWWRRPGASPWLLASWGAGVTALQVALAPAVERWADRTFTGHMVQHLLIIVVAAPLLVLARPLTIAGDRRVVFAHGPTARRVRGLWRRHAAMVGVGAFVSVLIVTHLTAVYDLALDHRWIHDAEHVAYLASAVALWAGLTSPSARVAPATRIGPVFAVIGAMAFVGVVLLSARQPLVAHYAERAGDDAALADQRRAASLMWVAGMGTTLPLLLLAVWRWATTEQRVAERTEELADRRGDERHPPPHRTATH